MKLLIYSSLIFLMLFLGCDDIVEDILLPDDRIKDCYWTNKIDQDNDGYTRSKYLVLEYKVGSDEIESVLIAVHYTGNILPVATKRLSTWQVGSKENIKISGLAHNQYDFSVGVIITKKGDKSCVNLVRNSSDDEDLKAQKFETDAQDQ
ncbi:MAG: hypothetical protein QME58_13960 [Bacteroidota bacterium]|nr:hypothetical protein [Bacteroidota bacterium]